MKTVMRGGGLALVASLVLGTTAFIPLARAGTDNPVLVQDLSSDASASNIADNGSLGIVPVDNPSAPTSEDSDPFCTNYAADVAYMPTRGP